jgi:hypothetical protein
MVQSKKVRVQRWSMRPSLHKEVSRLLPNNNLSFKFCSLDDPSKSTRTYDTNIMGQSTCWNPACSSPGWSSKQIALTIQMYVDSQYNARIYHQRCRDCGWVSRPKVDGSYADRVAYRIKKWCGVEMESQHYSRRSKGPHQSGLCEDCKNGHCTS